MRMTPQRRRRSSRARLPNGNPRPHRAAKGLSGHPHPMQDARHQFNQEMGSRSNRGSRAIPMAKRVPSPASPRNIPSPSRSPVSRPARVASSGKRLVSPSARRRPPLQRDPDKVKAVRRPSTRPPISPRTLRPPARRVPRMEATGSQAAPSGPCAQPSARRPHPGGRPLPARTSCRRTHRRRPRPSRPAPRQRRPPRQARP